MAAFLSGRSPRTMRAYAGDLEDFAHWSGAASTAEATRLLLAAGPGPANEAALRYKAQLIERGLAPATVNRRLAALRSLVKLARTLGQVTWSLDVEGLKSEAYRDTRGPGREGFRKLLDQLAGQEDPRGLRDRALVQLLYHLGLRRAEAVGLDLADLDLDAGHVSILGKGRREKERLSLPEVTRKAITDWLMVRGPEPGPLFVALDRGSKGKRLSTKSVYTLVRGLGERVGIRARPHGLRHSAITRALDLTNGDVRAVQRFSRHKNVQTLLKYDDNRLDMGGDVARRLAAED